eukprot:TRINITY_DN39827_c0_g1_i1.p1 TRINITY_DN39827_c0_g1~~TRINITY_DN39827_c0_g1_i1.p1  ORF type:complete len:290 (-),score=26.74 TRINITY_DN39827_c0_g1_i1:87-956(-)
MGATAAKQNAVAEGEPRRRSQLRSMRDSLRAGLSSRRTRFSQRVRRGVVFEGRVVDICEHPHKEKMRKPLLTDHRLSRLRAWLPVSEQFADDWVLLYSPRIHGVSLETCYRHCSLVPGPSIVIMREAAADAASAQTPPSTSSAVFGGFATELWHPEKLSYGEFTALAFSFRPGHVSQAARDTVARDLEVFSWCLATDGRSAQSPMRSNWQCMGMGSACSPAWDVDEQFLRCHCSFNPSETSGFALERPLASAGEVALDGFEIWAVWPDPPAKTLASYHFEMRLVVLFSV